MHKIIQLMIKVLQYFLKAIIDKVSSLNSNDRSICQFQFQNYGLILFHVKCIKNFILTKEYSQFISDFIGIVIMNKQS